jgi:predicted solute-binding protein
MTRVRVGAVSYLNARPCVVGLDRQPRFDVRLDLPARCAALLHEGSTDLGLVPSIEYLRGSGGFDGYRIVPDVAIASFGPVASVALYSRRPISDVRSIALDTSSRTSVALTRVLCAHAWHIDPTFEPVGPDLPAMLERCDAALLIGDVALFLDHRKIRLKPDATYSTVDTSGGPNRVRPTYAIDGRPTSAIDGRPTYATDAGPTYATDGGAKYASDGGPACVGTALSARAFESVEKIDLGDTWTKTTGLPFVYAFWAGRPGALTAEDVRALQAARDAGVADPEAVASDYLNDPAQRSMGARYLRDNIKYYLGEPERAGLETFYRYAAQLGLVPEPGPLRFF